MADDDTRADRCTLVLGDNASDNAWIVSDRDQHVLENGLHLAVLLRPLCHHPDMSPLRAMAGNGWTHLASAFLAVAPIPAGGYFCEGIKRVSANLVAVISFERENLMLAHEPLE